MILCKGQWGIENTREVGQLGRENTRKVAHKPQSLVILKRTSKEFSSHRGIQSTESGQVTRL